MFNIATMADFDAEFRCMPNSHTTRVRRELKKSQAIPLIRSFTSGRDATLKLNNGPIE